MSVRRRCADHNAHQSLNCDQPWLGRLDHGVARSLAYVSGVLGAAVRLLVGAVGVLSIRSPPMLIRAPVATPSVAQDPMRSASLRLMTAETSTSSLRGWPTVSSATPATRPARKRHGNICMYEYPLRRIRTTGQLERNPRSRHLLQWPASRCHGRGSRILGWRPYRPPADESAAPHVAVRPRRHYRMALRCFRLQVTMR
jgi:hypothetical protein